MATLKQPGVWGEHELPQDPNDGTLVLQAAARPGVVCGQDQWVVLRYLHSASWVHRAWEVAQLRYLPQAVAEQVGADARAAVEGIVPALKLAGEILLGTTATGAIVGGGIGALAGGVGAAPGALLGGEAGLDAGLFVLNWLGLGFLVVYVGANLAQVGDRLASGVREAWDSCGSPAAIDRAARHMAAAFGTLISLVLQAIAAYVAKEGMSAALEKLGRSRLGAGLRKLIETKPRVLEEAQVAEVLNHPKFARPMEPPLVRARIGTALKFMKEKFPKWTLDDLVSRLKGIDFSKPVELVELAPNDVLAQQFNGRVGQWFTKAGTPIDRLGIAPGQRRFTLWKVTARAQALESTAAAAADTWTDPGLRKILVSGGGKQYLVGGDPRGFLEYLVYDVPGGPSSPKP